MALWALGMAVLGSLARAGVIDFNPTGSNSSPVYTIGGIDLAPAMPWPWGAPAHSWEDLSTGLPGGCR